MKIKDLRISKEEIKVKIDRYNANYDDFITKKNVLSRVTSKCNNNAKHTLI